MDRESKLFGENIEHPADVISRYDIIPDQLDMRIDLVLKVLMEHDLKPENMDAAIGRGEMLLDAFIYQMAKDIEDMSSVKNIHYVITASWK